MKRSAPLSVPRTDRALWAFPGRLTGVRLRGASLGGASLGARISRLEPPNDKILIATFVEIPLPVAMGQSCSHAC